MMKTMTRIIFAAAALLSLLVGLFWLWFLYEYGRQDVVGGRAAGEQALFGYGLLAGFWFLLALAFFLYYRRLRR